jgi:N-acetylmuramoyl-L-alanine amidase
MKRRSIFVFVLLSACLSVNVFAEKGPKPPLKTIIIDPGHGGKDGGAQGAISREAIIALEIGLKLRNMMKAEMPELNVLMTRESDDLPGGHSDKNAALRWRAEYANQNNGDLFISIHLNASLSNQRYGKKAVGTRQETYYVYSGKGKKRKKIAKTRTVTKYERYKLPATVLGTQTYILARDWYEKKVNAVGKKTDLYEGGEGEADSLDQAMLALDPVQARIMAQQYTKYFFQKSLTLATYCEEEFAQQGRYSWGVQQRDWDGIWVLQATQMPSILVETGFVDNATEEQYLTSEKGQEEVARAILNAVKRYKQMLENPSKEPLKAKASPTSEASSDQLAKEAN